MLHLACTPLKSPTNFHAELVALFFVGSRVFLKVIHI
jgi:hypothetical protein